MVANLNLNLKYSHGKLSSHVLGPNNATIKVTSCAFTRIFWVQTTRQLDKFTVNRFCIVTNVLSSSRNNPS